MLGIFKRKSKKEKLQEQYQKLTQEAYELSHTNRRLGDQKLAEAEAILVQIADIDMKS